VLAVAALLSACGGGSSSDANQAGGTYKVAVLAAKFPTAQRLGETSQLRLEVRNSGSKPIPALTVTVSIGGHEGQDSSLPFGVRNPQPGLAQPDRPVWVLAMGYPKLSGSEGAGGAQTANLKTFDFGPLRPDSSAEAVWKLSAVKAGSYTLLYSIGAGLGTAKTETASGVAPGGSFAVRISSIPPNTTVTDSGEVVEVGKQKHPGR
jgi:hypothetical protein